MRPPIIEDTIISYLEGKLDSDEQQELLNWVQRSKDNAITYTRTKDAWEAAYVDANAVADTKKEWKTLKYQLIGPSIAASNKIKRTLRIWQAVAAVVSVMLSLSALWYVTQSESTKDELQVQTIVPSGEKTRLVLPDGTKVWINSSSVLTYNTDYGRENRNIHLDGEAYFEVAHNADMPFHVYTKDCKVKVLGTKFNVMAYSSSPYTETSLLEGKVNVSLQNGEPVVIKPGQMALVNGDKESIRILEGNINNIICWKDNVLKFDNTPFKQVIEKLNKWYGVTIELNNAELLEQKRFTFTVKSESLSELLTIMKLVQPLDYQIDGEQVSITILNL